MSVHWTAPGLEDLDDRAAAAMRLRGHGRGWHRSPSIAAGASTPKAQRLAAIAARMRERYLRTGKGCATRRGQARDTDGRFAEAEAPVPSAT